MVGFVVYRRVGDENTRGREFDKEEQARREYRRSCDDAAALRKLLKKKFLANLPTSHLYGGFCCI